MYSHIDLKVGLKGGDVVELIAKPDHGERLVLNYLPYSGSSEIIESQEIDHTFSLHFFDSARELKTPQVAPSHLIEWSHLLITFGVVVLVTTLMTVAMRAAIYKDTQALMRYRFYNQVNREIETRKVTWKRVHGDVFRKPACPLLLSVSVGTGLQLLLLVYSTLIAAIFGVHHYLTGVLFMAFPMFAYANGLVSSKLYVFFNGSNWLSLTFLSAFSYPLIINIGYYLISNLDPQLAKNLTGGSLS